MVWIYFSLGNSNWQMALKCWFKITSFFVCPIPIRLFRIYRNITRSTGVWFIDNILDTLNCNTLFSTLFSVLRHYFIQIGIGNKQIIIFARASLFDGLPNNDWISNDCVRFPTCALYINCAEQWCDIHTIVHRMLYRQTIFG